MYGTRSVVNRLAGARTTRNHFAFFDCKADINAFSAQFYWARRQKYSRFQSKAKVLTNPQFGQQDPSDGRHIVRFKLAPDLPPMNNGEEVRVHIEDSFGDFGFFSLLRGSVKKVQVL